MKSSALSSDSRKLRIALEKEGVETLTHRLMFPQHFSFSQTLCFFDLIETFSCYIFATL